MYEEKIKLIPGSKYIVTSLESRDKPLVTTGIFKNYMMLGEADAICMELDSSHKELAGKLRIIPVHMIIAIDIVKPAKEAKKKEEGVERYVG
ncbi:MAG: hypothetical protein QMC98_01730 [Candidatus Thermoplasmatota archaeon]|nr:hypothetical protein [Candidatus Thermoplasmatota archaeon]